MFQIRIPRHIRFCETPGYACGVAVDGDYAYVADYDSGLRIIDISDPEMPAKRIL